MPDNDDPNRQHQLKVLCDETGHRMAQKLFDTYIRRKNDNANMRRQPEFLLALDRFMSSFGGEPLPDEDADRGPREDDEDYGDNEDIHEATASEVDTLKRRIRTLLKK